MRSALAVLMMAAAFGAQAQVCDLEASITVTFDGKPDFKVVSYITAIPLTEIEKLHVKALKVVDVASKVQDKKSGAHMIEFDETRKCAGVTTKGSGVAGVMVQGVTLHGVNRIVLEYEKQLQATLKEQEDRVPKGKQRAMGRD